MFLTRLLRIIWNIPRNLLVLLVRIYQKTLSPDHSWLKRFFPYGYCKYYPTCSEYGAQAITKYGAIRGSLKAIIRIFKCNPCSKGGIDKL